jgi:signal transduction histidine kinase
MINKSGNIIVTSYILHKKFYIQIHDEGIGIHKSMYKKIFEPGVTTKSRGWGLGLSLTKRIIEEYHNGNIRVLQSVAGEGTTLEIVLPT